MKSGVQPTLFDFSAIMSTISRMLKIRLQRVARKHIPIFRVVLTDSRNSTKSGKFHEVLGTYNLVTDEKRVNAERVKYWISKGAQPSGTVHNFLVGERIIPGKKINVLPKRRPIKPAPTEASGKDQPPTTDPAKSETANGASNQPQAEKKEEAKAEQATEKPAEPPVAQAA